MTLELAAIDRDLDALAAGLDLAALLAAAPAHMGLDAVDAELSALASGVSIATQLRPPRVERPVAAPVAAQVAAPAGPVAAPPAPPIEVAPAPTAASAFSAEALFGEEASTSLRMDLSLAEEVVGADSLFGDDAPFHERPTHSLEEPRLDDPERRFSVSDDLAAMLEGELDPNEFGPSSEQSSDDLDGEFAIDEGELEVLVDDEPLEASDAEPLAASDGEPLPSSDTSRSTPPASDGGEGDGSTPEGGEKKGFFKKLFGK